MLVLSRKESERIKIGDNITVKVLTLKSGAVVLGIDAPRDVAVLRGELEAKSQKQRENFPCTP